MTLDVDRGESTRYHPTFCSLRRKSSGFRITAGAAESCLSTLTRSEPEFLGELTCGFVPVHSDHRLSETETPQVYPDHYGSRYKIQTVQKSSSKFTKIIKLCSI